MFGPRTRRGMRAGTALAAAAGLAGAAHAATRPHIRTDRGCYVVGQPVHVTGTGFGARRQFDLAVDGVDFGQSTTSATGGFAVRIGLGGLNGVAQHVESLNVTDGAAEASAQVTLTARSGARFLATRGSGTAVRAPLEVWGFSPNGPRRPVYLHYLTPGGRPATTSSLGRTGGQCGYLRTAPRRVFPFTPSTGTWTLQIDTQRGYAARPRGPVQRIRVTVG